MNKENEQSLKLTISQRISAAISAAAISLVVGLALVILSPVFLITYLLKSQRTDWDGVRKCFDDLSKRVDDLNDGDSNEEWKKNHKDLY